MSDALLPYFNRELQAIRQLAQEFAEAHPKVAGRLRMSGDAVDDPHVERLLDGVAFLAARVHHRLDDEFPELTDALLGVLYPHYLAPVPSCTVLQLGCQPDLLVPFEVASGLTMDSEPVRGESCRFRTAYPVTLWPIEIESVRLSGLPLAVPANPLASGAVSALRIVLKCSNPEVTFAQLGVERLRFFLRAPANTSLPLYELLCGHTLSVAYADGPTDPAPVVVGAEAIQPVGFAPEEALFPWPARSFSGFRLLTEYFAFPEKFLFLDFTQMEGKTLTSGGNRLEVFVYLDRAQPELERMLGNDVLALGCTPAVNLFEQRCEPVQLTGSELYLAPDDPEWAADRPADAVLSIDTLCTNRDLPAELPFGRGLPRLRLVEGVAAITKLTALTAPSAALRAPLREQGFWRLISHLSLGHLSVVGGAEGAAALKEVLRLYDLRDSAETRAAIDGLLGISARAGTARVPGARVGAFCRGLDVALEFDQRTWQVGGLYLLAAVLDRFLALHATVNSFVRTKATLRGRPGNVASWPARAGAHVLL